MKEAEGIKKTQLEQARSQADEIAQLKKKYSSLENDSSEASALKDQIKLKEACFVGHLHLTKILEAEEYKAFSKKREAMVDELMSSDEHEGHKKYESAADAQADMDKYAQEWKTLFDKWNECEHQVHVALINGDDLDDYVVKSVNLMRDVKTVYEKSYHAMMEIDRFEKLSGN